MTRDMFLQELRIALQGQISQVQVNEQLRYYENYIIEESRKGRTEEEVITSLGSPRLIAKTIIQMFGNTLYQDTWEEQKEYGSTGKGGKKRGFYAEADENGRWDIRYGRFRFRSWYAKLMLGVAAILFFVLLVRIGLLLLPVVASAFMVGAIVYVLFQIFFGNKK